MKLRLFFGFEAYEWRLDRHQGWRKENKRIYEEMFGRLGRLGRKF